MSQTSRLITMIFVLLVGACDEHEADPRLELAFRSSGESTASTRPPGGGGFINNGLHDPQVGGIDPGHALDTIEGMNGALLDDPDRVATAQYLVECALPAGASITKEVDGVLTEFEGALGLAPEWEWGACDQDCQEWVSACLLARTNVSQQEVPLWLKGDHPALGTGASPDFPHYEASFFGNLFVDPEAQHMCLGPVVGPVFAQLQGRTCSTITGGYCDMTQYSLCELTQRCEFEGLLAPMAVDCRPGTVATGAPLRTISTYVSEPLL